MTWGRALASLAGVLCLAAPGFAQQPAPQPAPEGENPLEKILKLMEEVEDRLYEADAGKFTQAEQKKIVEAMRFEDKTKAALDELIERIENSPP